MVYELEGCFILLFEGIYNQIVHLLQLSAVVSSFVFEGIYNILR